MRPLPRRLATWGTSLVAALVILSATMVAANALARGLQRRGIRNEADDPIYQ